MNTQDLLQKALLFVQEYHSALGALFAGLSVLIAATAIFRGTAWNKRKAAMDAIEHLTEAYPEIESVARNFPHWPSGMPIPGDHLQKAFKSEPGLEVKCKHILDLYENLATGVLLKIYNEKVVKTSRRRDVVVMFLRFQFFIHESRKAGHATAYNHLEEIARSWAKGDEAEELTGHPSLLPPRTPPNNRTFPC